MRHHLLRLGFALLVAGLVFPAGARARQDTDRAAHSRPAHSQLAMPAGWSAGPVHRWSGYSRPGGSRRVRELQRRLNRLGYASGPVDGLFGPRTERATRRFQARHGLPVDAIAGRRTLRALRERGQHHGTPHGAPTPGPVTAPLPSHLPPVHTPAASTAPTHPPLPAVPLIIAIVLIGASTFVWSYLRTGVRIRRVQSERTATEASRPRAVPATPRPEARP
jgi:peptidoglycan hydrolase-like protein with peptidoglycan-binding domain